MIDADGKLLHSEEGAVPVGPLRATSSASNATRSRASRGDPDAIDPWQALVAGRASLVMRTEGSRRHSLVIENAPASHPIGALTSAELATVSYTARGLTAKLVAYALGVSEPAVSARLSSAATKSVSRPASSSSGSQPC